MWGKLQRDLRVGLVVCLLAAIVIIVFSPFVDLPPTVERRARQFAAWMGQFADGQRAGDTILGFISPFSLPAEAVLLSNPARVLLC